MKKKQHPERGAATSAASNDDFGMWLKPQDQGEAASETAGTSGAPAGAASDPPWSLHRAGRGPLASVVSAPGVAGDRPQRHPERMRRGREARFVPLDRVAGLAILALGALIVAGAFAIHYDLRSLSALDRLNKQNHSIQQHNQARNTLVDHLARTRAARLAELNGYVTWLDKSQKQGVIVFVPDGNGQPIETQVGTVDLGGLRKKVDKDIAALEHWDPPPPLSGYNDMRFQTAELLGSRLPVLVGFAVAGLSLVLWSSLAYRNLPSLAVESTAFRLWQVPAWWLIPGLNFFLPCAVMGEIWHGSNPRKLRNPGGVRVPMVGFWWTAVLGGAALTAVSVYLMSHAVGIALMVQATRFAAYADVAAIVVGVVTIALIAAGSVNQLRRRKLVETVEAELGMPGKWRTDFSTPTV